jgi:2-keto-4-pentenoate hydratase/2-oxohepta-3-ene-1,7-dioic acid hydratase in catechol pathway
MRLVTFEQSGHQKLGGLIGDARILDLAAAQKRRSGSADPAFTSMQTLIEAGPVAWDRARALLGSPPQEDIVERSAVQLRAPLPRPVRLRDCSLFLEHMEKALKIAGQRAVAAAPDAEAAERERNNPRYVMQPIFKERVIYYNADAGSVSGTDEDIVWPKESKWIDYELEWACVVGKTARDVAPAAARSHIFGYTIFNDWSARDVQMAVMAGNLGPGEGKDFDGGYGLGPCIATPDEFSDPYNLTMTARVNGEEWSRGTTASMHHRFEDAVAQFSRGKWIRAGEVIGSGTVLSGCGFELGRQLALGDTVELEIEGIGVLRNKVVAAPA